MKSVSAKLFTDYLDDVSNRYVDQTILLNARGSKAVEMAYRGGELKGGNPVYPSRYGTVRVVQNTRTSYYFTGIKLSIPLISKRILIMAGEELIAHRNYRTMIHLIVKDYQEIRYSS